MRIDTCIDLYIYAYGLYRYGLYSQCVSTLVRWGISIFVHLYVHKSRHMNISRTSEFALKHLLHAFFGIHYANPGTEYLVNCSTVESRKFWFRVELWVILQVCNPTALDL